MSRSLKTMKANAQWLREWQHSILHLKKDHLGENIETNDVMDDIQEYKNGTELHVPWEIYRYPVKTKQNKTFHGKIILELYKINVPLGDLQYIFTIKFSEKSLSINNLYTHQENTGLTIFPQKIYFCGTCRRSMGQLGKWKLGQRMWKPGEKSRAPQRNCKREQMAFGAGCLTLPPTCPMILGKSPHLSVRHSPLQNGSHRKLWWALS